MTTQDTINRLNDLAIESVQSIVDAGLQAQRQSAQAFQAWLAAVEANQQAGRELTGKLVSQAREAQALWLGASR